MAPTAHKDAFLKEFLPVRDELLAFVFSVVPSHAEAEDIFQNASVVLWERFETFTPGTDFRAWARRPAEIREECVRTRGGHCAIVFRGTGSAAFDDIRLLGRTPAAGGSE